MIGGPRALSIAGRARPGAVTSVILPSPQCSKILELPVQGCKLWNLQLLRSRAPAPQVERTSRVALVPLPTKRFMQSPPRSPSLRAPCCAECHAEPLCHPERLCGTASLYAPLYAARLEPRGLAHALLSVPRSRTLGHEWPSLPVREPPRSQT